VTIECAFHYGRMAERLGAEGDTVEELLADITHKLNAEAASVTAECDQLKARIAEHEAAA